MLQKERKKREKKFDLELAIIKKIHAISPADLVIQEQLGSGTFGNVYKGLYLGTTSVALKSLTSTTEEHREEFNAEASMLQLLSHPNVVQFIGVMTKVDETTYKPVSYMV